MEPANLGVLTINGGSSSIEELKHDLLWRTTCRPPERGRIGIFNRSYYAEVLVVRVHPEILRNQDLREALLDVKNICKERYRSIVDLEEQVHRNGIRNVKSFLHLSKTQQCKNMNWSGDRAGAGRSL